MPVKTTTNKIAALYREEKIVNILGVDLKYICPGMPQQGLLVEFITSVFEKDDDGSLSKEDFFIKCIKKIVKISESDNEKEHANYVMDLLFWKKSNVYLFELIEQCFPEIKTPHSLKLEALAEILKTLFSEFGY